MKILLVFFIVSSLTISTAFAPSHPEYIGFDPPLKQISQGIPPDEVICNEGLQLIMRNGGSSACVRMETAIKLEERGWGVMPPPCCKDMPHLFITKAVLGIAQEFIKSSPTFAFDGMPETLEVELVAIRESFPEQYVIEADFDSLHGGYGDRTDQMVIQVITPHTMNLVVINGEVTSAILDGKWDELNQLQLPWTSTKGPAQIESMANQKQCEDIDGLWGIWSNRSPATASCNPSTSDGGKECSDSSQCQSFCQAKEGAQIGIEDTGMCYEYEFAMCMQEVRNGAVDAEWCQ